MAIKMRHFMRGRVINKRLVGFVFERACFKKNL